MSEKYRRPKPFRKKMESEVAALKKIKKQTKEMKRIEKANRGWREIYSAEATPWEEKYTKGVR